ncbi:MAG: alpha/beta hydrolase [Bacteroidota bacterium]
MKYLLNFFALLLDGLYTYSNYFWQRHPFTTYAYADTHRVRRKLDLYLPKNAEGPVPVILFIHGGGWIGGSRKHIQPAILNQVNRGYAIASLGYSLSLGAKWPTQILEIKAAIRWLKANAASLGLDQDRMLLWGTSAGGHLANMAGATNATPSYQGDLGNPDQDTRVLGTISWFGISDFHQMGHNGFWTWGFDQAVHILLGSSIYKDREKAQSANPINYVSEQSSPFHLAHGDRDVLTNYHQSVLLYEALRAKGVEATCQILTGLPHADVGFNRSDLFQASQDFLDRILQHPIETGH